MGLLDLFRSRPVPAHAPESPAPVVLAADAGSPPPGEVSAARRALGDGLQNVIAGLGTSSDKRFFTQYTMDFSAANQAVLEAMYMSSWLAGKIVGIPADDMTRERAELSWDGHDDDLDDDKAIKAEIERVCLWPRVNEALRWARLYGGAAIVIGIKNEKLSEPLNLAAIKRGSLECLLVYDRWYLASNGMRDLTAGSPNYGLPLQYIVAESAQPVHWSRVVRFNGRPLPKRLWLANAYWDGSELGHIIDDVKDYDAIRAGVASMVWNADVDILKLSMLKDVLPEDGGEAKIAQRLRTALMAKGLNKAFVLDKEDEYQQKTIQFAGIKDVIEKAILDVSGASDIPVTRLFGESPAGLTATGESDTRNYYDGIGSKRETHLRPPLRPLLEVIVRSAIGRMPENFHFTFPPLWQVSKTEQATIEKTRADRDAVYLGQGVITEGLVARQLKSDNVYPTMEDKDVNLAEELATQPPPAIVPPGGVPPKKIPGAAPATADDPDKAAA